MRPCRGLPAHPIGNSPPRCRCANGCRQIGTRAASRRPASPAGSICAAPNAGPSQGSHKSRRYRIPAKSPACAVRFVAHMVRRLFDRASPQPRSAPRDPQALQTSLSTEPKAPASPLVRATSPRGLSPVNEFVVIKTVDIGFSVSRAADRSARVGEARVAHTFVCPSVGGSGAAAVSAGHARSASRPDSSRWSVTGKAPLQRSQTAHMRHKCGRARD